MLLPASSPEEAAIAVNSLGVDLLAGKELRTGNVVISPLSIQSAMAMAYAGADGKTRTEMARVLHYPDNEALLQDSMAALLADLRKFSPSGNDSSGRSGGSGKNMNPVALVVANRLFGQHDFAFRRPFLDVLEKSYQAPLQRADFASRPDGERKTINDWVAETTRRKIQDLIPPGGVAKDARLVLVNAVWLKAPWASPFDKSETKPAPFTLADGQSVDVPTMVKELHAGYRHQGGYSTIVLPYDQTELQFVVFLPDRADGLPALEKKLDAVMLDAAAKTPVQRMVLHLPKFRMTPPVLPLGGTFRAMGMATAFDQPKGSANFDRMAPRKADGYLFLSEVFHETFFSLDEEGTEAAAATAVVGYGGSLERVEPPEIRIDRPFLFAIQHRASGTCLFLGRLADPRNKKAQ